MPDGRCFENISHFLEVSCLFLGDFATFNGGLNATSHGGDAVVENPLRQPVSGSVQGNEVLTDIAVRGVVFKIEKARIVVGDTSAVRVSDGEFPLTLGATLEGRGGMSARHGSEKRSFQ